MGWMGDANHVKSALDTIGADKDENGDFLIVGKPPISFMGLGEELVLDDEVMYLLGGQPQSLVHLMNRTSYGLRGVTVIS